MKSYIMIDMSGSMAAKWAETKSAVNAFVLEVAKTDPSRIVEVCGFAGTPKPFDLTILRNPTSAEEFGPLGASTPGPDGYTPLFDAIGKLNAKLDFLRDTRVTIMIVTDGEENASKEVSHSAARAIIESWQKKDWDVTFLGADFNAFSQGASFGLGRKDVLNNAPGKLSEGMVASASRTMAYARGANTADLKFTDDQRKASS